MSVPHVEVLISKDQIQKRLAELGAQISAEYGDRTIVMVGVLKGSFMFMADLVRHITSPVRVEFIGTKSYEGTTTSGQVQLTKDLDKPIEGADVLLVEDIIDSGHTIASVLELLSTRKPRTLRVCTLLDKSERREVEVPVSYTGFSIPNKFVFGYGLDIDEYYRNLPFIGVVDLSRYEP